MTEDEWRETPPGQALTTFAMLMMSIQMIAIGGAVGSLATRGLSWLAKKRSTDERIEEIYDSEREESLRKALLVIASWSALEACIEDFCKAHMQMNPYLFEKKDILQKKVPITDLLAPEEERLDRIFKALQESSERRNGVDKFEGVLTLLDLGGDSPQVVKDTIYKAQMVRNVWSHKGGIADTQFVRNAAHLGFQKGDLVTIQGKDLNEYLNAILLYAIVIGNRHRALYGIEPVKPSKKQKTDAGTDYLAFYGFPIEDSEQDTSQSESDAPPASPNPQTSEAPPAQTSSTDSTQDQTP